MKGCLVFSATMSTMKHPAGASDTYLGNHGEYSLPEVDRIWGIWGCYDNLPKAIFYLLKGDYNFMQDFQYDKWGCFRMPRFGLLAQRLVKDRAASHGKKGRREGPSEPYRHSTIHWTLKLSCVL